MLRITNKTNRQISINNYKSLRPHETIDVDIPMNDNLARLREIRLIGIKEIPNTSSSNEPNTRSRRSKKNLESESE